MDKLRALQVSNPRLEILPVQDPQFQHYGRILPVTAVPWIAAAEQAVDFPDSGCRYSASVEALERLPQAEAFREEFCGGLDAQIGLCWGHNSRLNALEWHTCNEMNIAVRDMVLLLAKREELDRDGRLDSRKIKAFYLEQGTAVEIYADTLHYTPCQVTAAGFSSVVVLQRGTNLPLTKKQGRLWAANKWLLAHEENTVLTEKGAVSGIYGENWTVFPLNAEERK